MSRLANVGRGLMATGGGGGGAGGGGGGFQTGGGMRRNDIPGAAILRVASTPGFVPFVSKYTCLVLNSFCHSRFTDVVTNKTKSPLCDICVRLF